MNLESQPAAGSTDGRGALVWLALLSFVMGAASGLVATAFRLALDRADRFREAVFVQAHREGVPGLLLVIGIPAAAAGIAAWLVRRFSPEAVGSGIPQVEADLRGKWSGSALRIIPVKFLGGLLAIGGGMALGREGPCVQMGASLGHLIGKVFRCSEDEYKALLAAGAGAGLATAFNAPIAGVVFVLEELRRFDLRVTITALGASAGAIAVARFFLGQAPDFHVERQPYPGLGTIPTHLALGLASGLLGVAYSRTILGALGAADRIRHRRVDLRAAAIGGAVGVAAWFAPDLVGGGDAITQRMIGGTEAVFIFAFALRFVLGAVSYAARTPGGLFAPLLALGSQSGLLFGTLCRRWFPGVAAHSTEYAVVGMAALFAAVVQAPLTGIILVIELTGSFTLLLPMLVACFAAMLVAALLQSEPIYDSLRGRAKSESVLDEGIVKSAHGSVLVKEVH